MLTFDYIIALFGLGVVRKIKAKRRQIKEMEGR